MVFCSVCQLRFPNAVKFSVFLILLLMLLYHTIIVQELCQHPVSQQLETIKMFHRAWDGTGASNASGKIKNFLLCPGRVSDQDPSDKPLVHINRAMTRYLNAPCEKDMEHCCPGLVLLQSISGNPGCQKVTATCVWIHFWNQVFWIWLLVLCFICTCAWWL